MRLLRYLALLELVAIVVVATMWGLSYYNVVDFDIPFISSGIEKLLRWFGYREPLYEIYYSGNCSQVSGNAYYCDLRYVLFNIRVNNTDLDVVVSVDGNGRISNIDCSFCTVVEVERSDRYAKLYVVPTLKYGGGVPWEVPNVTAIYGKLSFVVSGSGYGYVYVDVRPHK
ncbi:MAG: hypothetical protein LM568_01420 [Desulfurococcaceae archaeon]|nr:hypothetical protein [Desulfurococcaceae archaeon]